MSSATFTCRRRPAQNDPSTMTPSLVDSFQNMSLRKGDTFHPTTSADASKFWDPLEASASSPLAPGRSPTCPKSLEDLLLGAGDRRTVNLLARVDEAVKCQSSAALSSILTEPEVLPFPTLVVHDTTQEATDKPGQMHSHESDSGIGSSIASTDENDTARVTSAGSTTPSQKALTEMSGQDTQRGLSKYACEQIHKHIVKPILREPNLQEFHPLIRSVPHRIGKKEIRTLRDLEKTLIFLAPDCSRSPYKYLQFCERSIRVLHNTVTTLHESDQRTPADRPYTQGYFFDLVEQIRRYAQILAVTRAREEKGEKTDEMDYSPDESVSLLGGVSHNGQPAQLVRHKDGKTISMATGEVMSAEDVASASVKRPLPDAVDLEDDDDDVLRSMARRKKNAKPEIHRCPLCEKEFKRPCDLTKHVKTHERPWKCPNDTCKYHEHGWPTEKERDRHVNDKHSSQPALYRCLFPPCPYTSKRESNCKQHMEKAHGWEYIRSKNNGKGRASLSHLPRGSVPQSPASSVLTPLTPIAPSPSVRSLTSASVSGSSRHDSMPPPFVGNSSTGTPAMPCPSPDFADHFNMNFNFNFNDMSSAWPITPAMSDDRRQSFDTSSSNSGLQLDGSVFDDGISPDDLTYGFAWNDFTFPLQQQATPDSIAAGPSHSSSGVVLQISPGAQLEQTFTYDAMHVDETAYGQGDFTLFSENATAGGSAGNLFPTMSEGTTWGSFGGDFYHQPLPATNSTLDDLFPELKGH